VGGHPVQNTLGSMGDAQALTPASAAMSKALKAQGFGFCGPTITHAFMQAAGMVNDHLVTCPQHARVAAMD
jgi:DNA-3-methyladenine glycosylase I